MQIQIDEVIVEGTTVPQMGRAYAPGAILSYYYKTFTFADDTPADTIVSVIAETLEDYYSPWDVDSFTYEIAA